MASENKILEKGVLSGVYRSFRKELIEKIDFMQLGMVYPYKRGVIAS
jgi:hypothetical protein